MKVKKPNKLLVAILQVVFVIFGLLIFGAIMYTFTVKSSSKSLEPCPSDLRICENGDSVARVEPYCFFNECSDGSKPVAQKQNLNSEKNIIAGQSAKNGCIISGCNSQICADKEVVTTCEVRAEYACLKNAVCERQNTGLCAWTQTSEQKACLQSVESLIPVEGTNPNDISVYDGATACEALVTEASRDYEPYQLSKKGIERFSMINKCSRYVNRACKTDSECGSFSCVNNLCLVKPCSTNDECPDKCGSKTDIISNFCVNAQAM